MTTMMYSERDHLEEKLMEIMWTKINIIFYQNNKLTTGVTSNVAPLAVRPAGADGGP